MSDPETNEWPPVKMALWRVLMEEQLNDGHYIKAFPFVEKLYAAVLAAPVAAPVQVKALEWSEEQKGNLANQAVWPCHDWEYWIYRDDEGKPFILCMNITPDWLPASPVIGSFDTLEAAKAAAQADYETRIRSALISGDTSNG